MQHADLLNGHQRPEAGPVLAQARRGHDQLRIAHQWQPELPYRRIKAERGFLQHAIGGRQRQLPAHPLHVVAQGAMANRNALGLPGGAGGVDHIRQVLRVQGHGRHTGVHRRWRAGLVQQVQAHARQLGQRRYHRRVAEQQADATVGNHVGQPLLGVIRVQRHVGAPRAVHRQQGHDHFHAALEGHAHQHVRAHALLDQLGCKAVGARVQLGAIQASLADVQRRRLRVSASDPLVNEHLGGRRDLGLVPLCEHALFFITAQ